jgi:hypothetical protein
MVALALMLLVVSSRVEVADEVYEVGAEKWGYGPVLQLQQQAALIGVHFETENRTDRVRLALMRRDEMEKLRAGLPHGVIDVTGEMAAGSLSYQVPSPGEYVVVIENQARTPASVRVHVWLDFARPGPLVTQLSPRRQLTVIAISFAVFFAIVSFSARRLLKVVRRT